MISGLAEGEHSVRRSHTSTTVPQSRVFTMMPLFDFSCSANVQNSADVLGSKPSTILIS